MDSTSPILPYLGVVLAISCWGSFTVPLKHPAVIAANLHPLWFQCYVGVGVALSSIIFVPIATDSISDFTPWGTVSALMWVLCNSSAMAAVNLLGIGGLPSKRIASEGREERCARVNEADRLCPWIHTCMAFVHTHVNGLCSHMRVWPLFTLACMASVHTREHGLCSPRAWPLFTHLFCVALKLARSNTRLLR